MTVIEMLKRVHCNRCDSKFNCNGCYYGQAIIALKKQISIERILERLEEQKSYADDLDDDLSCGEYTGLALAIEIVKEEGGLND